MLTEPCSAGLGLHVGSTWRAELTSPRAAGQAPLLCPGAGVGPTGRVIPNAQ